MDDRSEPEVTPSTPVPIGRGRSAVVYGETAPDGRRLVRKVFLGETLSQIVLFVLTGSANPYTWCEAAMRTAVARRRVLDRLVGYWFGDVLRLPRTEDWGWDETHRAFWMRMERIDGGHLPLRSPLDAGKPDPIHQLVDGIMKPLQGHLTEAGLDGLVWQAGRGNPVAAANFMLGRCADGDRRWVWIDLESGVPALFAMNPLATLRFYLPKSIHHRRWLFDDVDVPKLRRYLETHDAALSAHLGPAGRVEFDRDVLELETQQNAWRSIPRHRRGIEYERTRGRLTETQVAYYATRPLRWTARVVVMAVPRVARKAVSLAGRGWRAVRRIPVRRLAYKTGLFSISQRYRWHVAQAYVRRGIHDWVERGFLDHAAAATVRRQVREDDASAYLTDFGVHLAIKPVVKLIEWWLMPTLWMLGVIGDATLAVALISGGMIGRTAYTSGRLIQASLHGQRLPWVALGVGLLPVVGNAAYPAQLVACSHERNGGLARFILDDVLARMGRKVPIWGGRDSLVEHRFNRLGEWFAGLGRRQSAAPSVDAVETPVAAPPAMESQPAVVETFPVDVPASPASGAPPASRTASTVD